MEKLFQPLTIQNAPEASKPVLEQIQKAFGFIPNLMATFANSPAVLSGYMALEKNWEKSSLSPIERQLILLSVSVQNSCGYCTAAHSTILKGGLKLDADSVKAVRSGKALSNPKLNALVNLTKEIVGERGHASSETVKRFLDAGYTKNQVMEILVGVALKTISNYLDHISETPLDSQFSAEK